MSQSKEQVRIETDFEQPLRSVRYPGFDTDILSMGLVVEARREGGRAVVRLRPVAAPVEVREQLEKEIAQALHRVAGVAEVEVDLPAPAQPKPQLGPRPIPGVKTVIPVASGKGGVGKSTVAVNLALGLAGEGLKAGILDLDLYGPSIPLMLGLRGAQPQATADHRLAPLEAHGVKALSIGFLMEAERALIWRGPLIIKAVRQLLHEVAWAPLDVLVLDLPPGTGDVQISMTQEVPVTGAVVVTTPQDVALIDVIKAVDMFQHTQVPILGVVENMSYFVCPDCGSRHDIFGHGTVEPLCRRLGVDYLGELPLDAAVRRMMDQGRPAVGDKGDTGEPYRRLARRVKEKLYELGALQED